MDIPDLITKYFYFLLKIFLLFKDLNFLNHVQDLTTPEGNKLMGCHQPLECMWSLLFPGTSCPTVTGDTSCSPDKGITHHRSI